MTTLPPRTIFCIGASALAREVSALTHPSLRVRWASDLATLTRMVTGAAEDVAACIVEANDAALATLEAIRQLAPNARRLAVTESCDLAMIHQWLDTKAADEMLYRPLDAGTLAQVFSAAIRAATPRPKASAPLNPRSAGSHA